MNVVVVVQEAMNKERIKLLMNVVVVVQEAMNKERIKLLMNVVVVVQEAINKRNLIIAIESYDPINIYHVLIFEIICLFC
jgi:hypothetical protein